MNMFVEFHVAGLPSLKSSRYTRRQHLHGFDAHFPADINILNSMVRNVAIRTINTKLFLSGVHNLSKIGVVMVISATTNPPIASHSAEFWTNSLSALARRAKSLSSAPPQRVKKFHRWKLYCVINFRNRPAIMLPWPIIVCCWTWSGIETRTTSYPSTCHTILWLRTRREKNPTFFALLQNLRWFFDL